MTNTAHAIAKSALIDYEMDDKLNRGATEIEIQLIGDLEAATKGDWIGNPNVPSPAENLFNEHIDLIRRSPIVAVHAPLCNDEDMELELASNHLMLAEVCKLAQMIADEKEREITVIIHLSTAYKVLTKLGVKNNLIRFAHKLVDDNPSIRIGIENTNSFIASAKNRELLPMSAYSIDRGELHIANVDFAKACEHPRIGVVVDYCHAMMAQHFFDTVSDMLDGEAGELFAGDVIEEIFKQSAPLTVLYHLVWGRNAGYGADHGQTFHKGDSSEEATLSRFAALYRECCELGGHADGEVPVTLEVGEERYDASVNYSAAREAWEMFYRLV